MRPLNRRFSLNWRSTLVRAHFPFRAFLPIAGMAAFLLATPVRGAKPAEKTADKASVRQAPAVQQVDGKLQKLVERETKKWRKQIQGKLRKGKGEFFALALIESTYHTEVFRTVVENVTVNGQPYEDRKTEFHTGGDYLPVPAADFQVVEGSDKAVDSIVNHLSKYVRLPTPKRKKGTDAAEQPPATGDWHFVGRFADQAAAEKALEQAKAEFEAAPNWRLTDDAELGDDKRKKKEAE